MDARDASLGLAALRKGLLNFLKLLVREGFSSSAGCRFFG